MFTCFLENEPAKKLFNQNVVKLRWGLTESSFEYFTTILLDSCLESVIRQILKLCLFSDSMKPPANHVAMMQIDCEVINTSLVHISEDAIPVHLNVRMKSETGSSSKAASNSTLERNDSRKSFESFGNYQANVTGKHKNSFNDFEKSNNITR